MPLAAVMESLEGVDESIAALYTQKGEKFELTGITGVRTQADIDRIQGALDKEKGDHKGTREKYHWAAEMDSADILAKLDKFPELEAAAAGKLDEAAIEEMVTRRVDGTINSKTAPLERQVATLTSTNEELLARAEKAEGTLRTNAINESFMGALGTKVEETALADAKMLASSIFEIREDDNAIVTKEGTEFTPGLTAEQLLPELQEKRRHWFGQTGGGGANPARMQIPGGGVNPWSGKGWNMTEQGKILREKGREYAQRLASSVGVDLDKPVRPKVT